MNYKDGQKKIIKGITFKYDSCYDRFECIKDGVFPAIICPKCFKDIFQIGYGNYECIAMCIGCGHKMTVYDG